MLHFRHIDFHVRFILVISALWQYSSKCFLSEDRLSDLNLNRPGGMFHVRDVLMKKERWCHLIACCPTGVLERRECSRDNTDQSSNSLIEKKTRSRDPCQYESGKRLVSCNLSL